MFEPVYFGKQRSRITKAVLHCAAVPTGWHLGKTLDQMVETIRQWHKERGFNDIGYHYVVDPEGFIAPGRHLSKIGAHTLGRNHDALGILLIESRQITAVRDFEDYFTQRQRLAVTQILKHHAIEQVTGHNDHAAKLCPGFAVDPSYFLPQKEKGFKSLGELASQLVASMRKSDG